MYNTRIPLKSVRAMSANVAIAIAQPGNRQCWARVGGLVSFCGLIAGGHERQLDRRTPDIR